MKQPTAKFRAGQVSSALWENEIKGPNGPRTVLKATVERRFMDRDGVWKSSGSFSRNELPLAVFCLQKAFECIIERETASGGDGNGDEAGGGAPAGSRRGAQ